MTEIRKFVEIERLRGIAIAIVLYVHLGDVGLRPLFLFRLGWPGVDLFFVISGFVVTLSLVRLLPLFAGTESFSTRLRLARPAIGVFFSRRFFRIAPMALLWIAVPLSLSVFYNRSGIMGSPSRLWQEGLAASCMAMDFLTAYFPGERLGHYWSLSVEEQFYLILPLIFFLLPTKRKRRMGAAIGILVIALLVRPFFLPPHAVQSYHLPYLKFDALMAGVLLALLRSDKSAPSPWLLRRDSALCITVFCVLGLWCGPALLREALLRRGGLAMGWLFSAVLVFLASLDRGLVLDIPLLGPALQHLGARSYGIYLIQRPLQNFLLESLDRLGLYPPEWINQYSALFVCLYVVLLLLLAELCYRCIERPLIQFGREREQKTRSRKGIVGGQLNPA